MPSRDEPSPDEIEAHCFSLNGDIAHFEQCQCLLSSDELQRAAKFCFDRDRRRFVICRGTLRELLGERLGIAPEAVRFQYGPFGKPILFDKSENSHLHFNVSHSHDLALVAISWIRDVGCDIERIDSSFAGEQIPEQFFSPFEIRSLRALPEAEQLEAFFRCWTRKEAYIKARGLGVAIPLDCFDVTLAPREPAALLRGADGWSVQSFDAPPGYAAAIVARGNGWKIVTRSI